MYITELFGLVLKKVDVKVKRVVLKHASHDLKVYFFLLKMPAPPRTALTASNAKIGLPVAGIV